MHNIENIRVSNNVSHINLFTETNDKSLLNLPCLINEMNVAQVKSKKPNKMSLIKYENIGYYI